MEMQIEKVKNILFKGEKDIHARTYIFPLGCYKALKY